ncbi:glutamate 5-kinase [Chloroflexota bacterium]|nr:glutamate 5-kinase [Chloroflexota bacterium]
MTGSTHQRLARIVVKIGTGILTGGARTLDHARMADVARQIVEVRQSGVEVLLVSSGAIAAGRAHLALDGSRRDIPAKQMLAAIGQHRLMNVWDRIFADLGVTVAQTLLTKGNLRSRPGYLNTRNTLLGLVEVGVLPIINENDVVASDEIRVDGDNSLFGDNDNLAAMVANLADAQLLLNLTNTGGLYTADPRTDPDARLVPEVLRITRSIEALAGGAGTDQGTGGMRTKIESARLATASGVDVVIAPGMEPDVLVRLVAGEAIGTRFRASNAHQESRQRWILSALTRRAAVHVDHGAADALRRRGRSLLAAGVLRVDGRFGRGDPLSVIDPDGDRIACGLANYASSDVARIKGMHSATIADALGYAFGEEVIHRNNLVLVASRDRPQVSHG